MFLQQMQDIYCLVSGKPQTCFGFPLQKTKGKNLTRFFVSFFYKGKTEGVRCLVFLSKSLSMAGRPKQSRAICDAALGLPKLASITVYI